MILVTGAAGTLGSEICRQLPKDEILALDIDEYGLWKLANELGVRTMCDSITRYELWREMAKLNITTVINCAAVKHVWTSQQHAGWSREVNHIALHSIIPYLWKLVHISTDKAVIPTCEYGLQKLNAERAVLAMGGVVVRLVNIHNSRGCAEEIFREQIANGGPVTARDPEMRRYFTTVEQAAEDVLTIAGNADSGLYMPDPGDAVEIDEIIDDLLSEYAEPIPVKYTGIQDGEKLCEDVLTDYEKTEPVAWSDRISKVVRR